jgi:hypothetical protein
MYFYLFGALGYFSHDGDLPYWTRRLGKHPQLSRTVAKLLKAQNGKCKHCGLTFREGDEKATYGRLTTLFLAHWAGQVVIPISNFSTVIAMTIKQLPMGAWDVPMIRVKLLRSRMRRKSQVRFCRRAAVARWSLSLTRTIQKLVWSFHSRC